MTSFRWLSFLLGSLTVTLSFALLDLFISPDASICFQWLPPPLGNSDHAGVSIDFLVSPLTFTIDALFHCIAYDYSCADWDGLCDYLTNVPSQNIFKLSASATASEFCEWIQVGIDVYTPH